MSFTPDVAFHWRWSTGVFPELQKHTSVPAICRGNTLWSWAPPALHHVRESVEHPAQLRRDLRPGFPHIGPLRNTTNNKKTNTLNHYTNNNNDPVNLDYDPDIGTANVGQVRLCCSQKGKTCESLGFAFLIASSNAVNSGLNVRGNWQFIRSKCLQC